MAKYCGEIGYVQTLETDPGVWEEVVTERTYYGDVIKNNRRLQTESSVNDGINISNQLSIVADPFANENIYAMRYAKFMGYKWKISNVDVQYPRLILTLGGVYNGE